MSRPAPRLAPVLTSLLVLGLAAPPGLAQSNSIPAKPPAATPAVGTPAAPAPLARAATLARGRQLTRLFYAQQLGPVWDAFLDSAREGYGGDLEAFKAYRANGVVTYGKETRVVSEEVRVIGGLSYYLRTATFERGPRVSWTVYFALNAAGKVVEFGILGNPPAAPEQVG